MSDYELFLKLAEYNVRFEFNKQLNQLILWSGNRHCIFMIVEPIKDIINEYIKPGLEALIRELK